jgi:methyl-accepting chemotaxis protein
LKGQGEGEMKLKTKIILPILAIIMIGINVLGIIGYFQAKKIVLNQLYLQADNEMETITAIMKLPNSNISELIDKLRIGENGYGYIVDEKGIVALHADKKTVGVNLNEYDWGKTILKKQTGSLNYIFNNEERYTVFNKVNDRIAVVAIPVKEFVSPLNVFMGIIAAVLLITVILSGLAIFYLVNSQIIRPFNELVNAMSKAGEGDLGVSVEISSKDEIGALAQAFNKMIFNIKDLVHGVKDVIVRIDSSSGLITSSMNEISTASEEVSKTTQEIAAGATDQAQESNNTLMITKDLEHIVNDATESLKLVKKHTVEMEERNIVGNNSILDLDARFEENSKSIKTVADSISQLSSKSGSIGEILDSIKKIAAQTNLLALNAAIEAARAGEQGRGFAVVADEIKKLAQQSSDATGEIREIISDITAVINNVDITMESAKDIEKKSIEAFNGTKDAFKQIKLSVDEVVKQIDSLGKDITQINAEKVKVVNSVESIASVSQQTAAATEEISASAEEQTASIEEIHASLQELNNMVESLGNNIKVFKIGN